MHHANLQSTELANWEVGAGNQCHSFL